MTDQQHDLTNGLPGHIDPFRPTGCTCHDVGGMLQAALAGEDPPLCAVHDQPAIAEREAAIARAQRDDAAAQRTTARWEQRARDSEQQLAEAQAEYRQKVIEPAREGIDPLVLQLADAAGADPDPRKWTPTVITGGTTPIGDDTALIAQLHTALGGNVTHESPNPEPPAAA